MSEDAAGILDRNALIGIGAYWRDKQLDWTSGDLDYVGKHWRSNAADGDAGWAVWKFTWTAGNLARIEGPLTGSWTNRATLDWV
jgi:hypothetical protein